ncbi:MAG TPA: hypothetical protein VME22_26980 [Solirubrobacteraceae bacterium]|nr:hypothetical protein [Solirubrobacteraceae bacterium]
MRAAILLAFGLGGLFLVSVPVADAAETGGVHVSASYAVRNGHVTARGVVARTGALTSARTATRVELEDEVVSSSGASEWHVRATSPLTSRARRSPFIVRLKIAQAAGTITLRTSLVSGSHVLARSSSRTIRLGPALVVKSKLRPTTAQEPAGVVQSVSGSPSGTQTVVLARGAKVPGIGGALVLGVSTHAPDGLLGVVTSVSYGAGGRTSVTTRPATLEEAYSSFDAQINGTLGELANEDASAAAHAADVSIGSFANVAFSCDDPGVQHSITHSINLSELHVSSEIVIPSWSNGFSGPFINFDLGGHPKFDLGVSFGGYASCTADATVNIPLADTGLFVEIGPQFTLGASGAVSVNMDWEPWVNYGFSRGRDDPSNNYEAFHNDGHTTFSGNADLSVSLALKAGISLAGRLGVGGTIGPEIIGEVSASTATRAACLTVDAEVVAELTAYADVFFDDYNFTLGRFAFGHTQLYTSCASGGGGSGGGSGGSGGSSGGGGSGGSGGSGGGGSGGGGSGGAHTGATSVAVGYLNACALLTTGGVDCWGWGDLGDDSNEISTTPVGATGVTDAVALSAGLRDTCALLSTGDIDCWGDNEYGRLGDGSTEESTVPVVVKGISTAVAVAAGGYETCALLSGGTVDCWGLASYDEGRHQTTNLTPVPVSGLSHVTALAAGEEFMCALISNGTVDCWGENWGGQLGNGNVEGSATPLQVQGVSNATGLVARERTTCALLSDGDVECWGWGGGGQLAPEHPEGGNLATFYSPIVLSGIVDPTMLTEGYANACALFASGGIECWGFNEYGQLGNGTTSYISPKASVSGITNATAVSAGERDTCAVLAGGGVDCWGENRGGQLGDGTTESSAVPVAVSGIG